MYYCLVLDENKECIFVTESSAVYWAEEKGRGRFGVSKEPHLPDSHKLMGKFPDGGVYRVWVEADDEDLAKSRAKEVECGPVNIPAGTRRGERNFLRDFYAE